MTPIERVSVKSRALNALGLNTFSNKADIRAAYRKLAFAKHPDRNNGATNEFCKISEAYQYLTDNADALGIIEGAPSTPAPGAKAAAAPNRVSRPIIEPSETSFSEITLAKCQASFKDDDASHHVSTQLHRTGRSLTYFVPTAAQQGLNQVAVPTGELIDTRRINTQIVTVDHRDLSGGVFEVPSNVCAENFPGARSVHIRFTA